MLKMYKAEVLGKLPVAQHFLFGTILHKPELDELSEAGSDVNDHSHIHTFGDCCGIPVPAAFGAAQSGHGGPTLASTNRMGVRVIPFD